MFSKKEEYGIIENEWKRVNIQQDELKLSLLYSEKQRNQVNK